jgi:polyferredoxin
LLDIIDVVAGFTHLQNIVGKLSIKIMNNWTEGKAWMWLFKVAAILLLLDFIGISFS